MYTFRHVHTVFSNADICPWNLTFKVHGCAWRGLHGVRELPAAGRLAISAVSLAQLFVTISSHDRGYRQRFVFMINVSSA